MIWLKLGLSGMGYGALFQRIKDAYLRKKTKDRGRDCKVLSTGLRELILEKQNEEIKSYRFDV